MSTSHPRCKLRRKTLNFFQNHILIFFCRQLFTCIGLVFTWAFVLEFFFAPVSLPSQLRSVRRCQIWSLDCCFVFLSSSLGQCMQWWSIRAQACQPQQPRHLIRVQIKDTCIGAHLFVHYREVVPFQGSVKTSSCMPHHRIKQCSMFPCRYQQQNEGNREWLLVMLY
jgi:hypothetical protein